MPHSHPYADFEIFDYPDTYEQHGDGDWLLNRFTAQHSMALASAWASLSWAQGGRGSHLNSNILISKEVSPLFQPFSWAPPSADYDIKEVQSIKY
jgi:hypothetical protein